MISADSSSFTVLDLALTTMKMAFNKVSPSANEDFNVFVELFDQQPVYFLSESSVSLSGDLSISGSISGNTSTGFVTFVIHCLSPGSLTVTAVSGLISVSETITIKPQKLNFSITPPLSVKRFERFAFEVSVFENSLTDLSSYGPFTITITTDPSTTVVGALVLSTSSSKASFSNIQLFEIGSFKLVASSSDMSSISTSAITVNINYELLIEVEVPSYTPMLKYYYQFPVTVHNLTSSAPLSSASVKLFMNSTLITTQTTNSTGQTIFTLLFQTLGKVTLRFECDIASLNKELQVIVSDNQDDLCIIAQNASVCMTCVQNSFVINGTCVCFHNGTFSNTSGKCECPPAHNPVNNYCIDCGFYFNASEITSNYDRSFKVVWVYFDRNVNRKNLNSCQDILVSPAYFLEPSVSCLWISGTVLKIVIGEYTDLTYDYLEIDNYKVQAISDKCDVYIEDLIIPIQKQVNITTPFTEITAPDTFSIACTKSNLLISSTLIGKNVTYVWSVTITPNNSLVSTFISYQTSSAISIPFTMLSESILNLTLTTKYEGLESTYITTKSVKVTNDQNLDVYLNTQSLIKLRVSQSYTLVAGVDSSCGNSETSYTYKWTCNDSTLNISNFQSNSTPNSLTIAKYSLIALKCYTFQVLASDGSLSGTAETVICMIQSDLVIVLSRSSGSVSPSVDFIVNSTVSDPDDALAVISTEWSCIESSTFCLNKENSSLSLSQSSGNLSVSSLRERALYQFTLKAFTSLKVNYASLLIYVDPSIKGEVLISGPLEKINPDYIYNVIPKFTLQGKPEFKWSITNGEVDSSQLTLSNSFVGLPEASLIRGTGYLLKVQVKSSQFEGTLESQVNVNTNKGPACSEITYETLGDTIEVLVSGCVDLDDEDYPLAYQTGMVFKNKTVWVNALNGNPWSKVKLLPSAQKVVVKVCDALETCTFIEKELKVQNRLLEEDDLMTVMQETRDFQKIPNIIQVYMEKDISFATFLFLYEKFYGYFNALEMNLQNFQMFSNCLNCILALKDKAVDIVENSTFITASVVGRLGKRLKGSDVDDLIGAYEPFVNFTSFDALKDMLLVIADCWTTDLTPNAEITYSGTISYFRAKLIGAYYPGRLMKSQSLEVLVSRETAFSYSKVYDLTVFVIQVNQSIYLITNSTVSADYEDYYLQLRSLKESGVSFRQPVSITLKNSLKLSSAKCDSTSSSCKVTKVNNTHIQINIYNFSNYEIKDSGSACTLKSTPVYIISSLSFFFIIASIWVYLKDRQYKYEHIKFYRFLALYPLTSIFIPQHNPNRVMAMSHLCACSTFMLGAIGFTYNDLEKDLNTFNITIGDVTFKHLARGLIGLGLVQILSIFNLIVKINGNINKKLEYVAVTINFLFTAIGAGVVGVTCLFMCPESFDIWIVNFGIFICLHLFVFESSYSGISVWLVRKRASGVIKVTRAPEDLTNFSKDFKIIAEGAADTSRHSKKLDRTQTRSFINP
jgi:hypothetical protein